MRTLARWLPAPFLRALSLISPTARRQLAEVEKSAGNDLLARGRLNEAKACFMRAVSLSHDFAEAHNNLGYVYKEQGELEAAALHLLQAARLKPELANPYFLLGQIRCSQGEIAEAKRCYEAALGRAPDFVEARFALAMLMRTSGDFSGAERQLRRVVELEPDNPTAHVGLAQSLYPQGRFAEAHQACLAALRLDSRFKEAQFCLGNLYQSQGLLSEAQAAYVTALSIAPDYAAAEFNLALLLLVQGDLVRGFDHLEARWRANDLKPPAFEQPCWNGEALNGKRIFVYFEYGLGDTLHFVRYVSAVAARGAEVILGCQRPLVTLMRGVAGVSRVVSVNSISEIVDAGRCLDFDYHVPLWSLPRVFRTSLRTVPAPIPYVSATPDSVAHWSARIGARTAGLRVGLVWQGNVENPKDRIRSIPLACLAPLFDISGATFYSLQKEASEHSSTYGLIEVMSGISDFADTAGLCQNMDLVITVDTAVAHLAGAMGKPVWLLNRFESEWRWLLEREDSPWYPTMTIFRQTSVGDWTNVVNRVADRLLTAVSQLANGVDR